MAVSFVTKTGPIVEAQAPSRDMDPRIDAAVAVTRRHANAVGRSRRRNLSEMIDEVRATRSAESNSHTSSSGSSSLSNDLPLVTHLQAGVITTALRRAKQAARRVRQLWT